MRVTVRATLCECIEPTTLGVARGADAAWVASRSTRSRFQGIGMSKPLRPRVGARFWRTPGSRATARDKAMTWGRRP